MQQRLVAGRYRFLKRVAASPVSAVWLCEDVRSGSYAVGSLLAPARVPGLRIATGVKHPHLASLVDVITSFPADIIPQDVQAPDGAALGFAEWIGGRTLYEHLLESTIPMPQAVRTIASLASALAALHMRGAVHGAVSSRSVVVSPLDGRPGPVLTQLAIAPDGTFCSPERIRGAGPSAQDDVWALHVLLYNVLTGRRPFRARNRQALARAIVEARPLPLVAFDAGDDTLQSILDAGLAPDATRRHSTARHLEQALLEWLAKHRSQDEPSIIVDSRAAVPSRTTSASSETVNRPASSGAVLGSIKTVSGSYKAVSGSYKAISGSYKAVSAATPAAPPVTQPVVEQPLAAEASFEEREEPRAPSTPAPDHDAPAPITVSSPVRTAAAHDQAPPPAARVEPEPQADRPPAQPSDTSPPEPKPPASEAVVSSEALTKPVAAPAPQPARKPQLKVAWSAGVAVLATAFAAYVVLGDRESDTRVTTASQTTAAPASSPVASSPASAQTAAPTSAATLAPAPQAATASSPRTNDAEVRHRSDAEITSCVAGFFPDGSFRSVQDLSFVCKEADPRLGTTQMRKRVVLGARGHVTDGMREWARLDWHQLAAYAIMRHACCNAPLAPIELPEPKAPCQSMAERLDTLGRAYAERSDTLDLAVLGFEKEALCIHGKAQNSGYRFTVSPLNGGQNVFAAFLQRNLKRR